MDFTTFEPEMYPFVGMTNMKHPGCSAEVLDENLDDFLDDFLVIGEPANQ